MLNTNDEKYCETEKIWRRPGYFEYQNEDFSISKVNFPENMFCYANQGTVSTVKGNFAIYLDYVILGQLILTENNPENIDKYECKQNEVKLFSPLYDINTEEFLRLDTPLAFIMVRATLTRLFFRIAMMKVNLTFMYSVSKKIMAHIFQGTCFKMHVSELLEQQSALDFPDIFLVCPPQPTAVKKLISLWVPF